MEEYYIETYVFNRYLEDLAVATGHMNEIKLIEGLIVAAETLGGEVIFFSLSGILSIYLFYMPLLLCN